MDDVGRGDFSAFRVSSELVRIQFSVSEATKLGDG